MTFVLLLALVALGFALQRQARRIDALERQVAQLAASAEAPAAVPEPLRPEPRPRAARVILPPAPVATAEQVAAAPVAANPPAPAAAGATFEQLVGGRLPIWVGGAALAIAGYFLVGLAIESGLLTAAVRVLLATLFGFALLAAAEAAARLKLLADDPRVHQALAGAGLATLYAAAYLAGPHYGLIGPVAAFVMMAAITALALGLSLRRGSATALMGLVGGFATPLLAGAYDQAVVPLLFYLGLLSAGLFGLAAARGWLWLALSAAAGGFLWSGLLIATAAGSDALAAGGFVLLLALAATFAFAASGGRATARLRALPLAAAAAELALLIATTGFGAGAWGLYLLLSTATIVLAWRDARLTPAVAAALAVSAPALVGTAYSPAGALALAAAAGIAVLFGGAGHGLARRAGDGRWWAAIGAAGLVVPFAALWMAREALLPPAGWSALALLLAVPPLHLAWRSRGAASPAPPFDTGLTVGAATAAVFLSVALAVLLPGLMLPTAILISAVALAEGGRRLGDGRVALLAVAAAAVAVAAMVALSGALLTAVPASLAGERLLLPLLPSARDAALGALIPAPLIAFVAWRSTGAGARIRTLLFAAAGVAAAAGLYVLWKQLFAIRDDAAFVRDGFIERALLTQALFAAGWGAARGGEGWRNTARALTLVAALRVLWLDLVVFDPALVAQVVGPLPLANLIGLHFGAACLWIGIAWRAESGRRRQAALAALVAVAGGGTLLLVRQAFQGTLLVAGPVSRAEFYGYSAGGVLLAIALFGLGAWLRDRAMRIAGLGLLTLMVLKVFLVDAAALGGLLRIASFLGLGVTLIAIGWAYGRLLGREPPPPLAG